MSICEKQKIEIFKGESPIIEISLFNPDFTVLKLADATEITFSVRDEDGNIISKNLAAGVTIVDPAAGEISVALLEAETNLLKIGDNQDFEVAIDFSSGAPKRIAFFERTLEVKSRI